MSNYKHQDMLLKRMEAAGITDKNQQLLVLSSLVRESNLEPITENMNYTPERAYQVFGDKYFPGGVEEARAVLAQGQEAFTNRVYGGRLGNAPDEGYKYRGRGFIQLTGKSGYSEFSKKLYGDDRLVKNPDLLNDPEVAADVAIRYVKDRVKEWSPEGVTKAIGPRLYSQAVAKTRTIMNQFQANGWGSAPTEMPTEALVSPSVTETFDVAQSVAPAGYSSAEDVVGDDALIPVLPQGSKPPEEQSAIPGSGTEISFSLDANPINRQPGYRLQDYQQISDEAQKKGFEIYREFENYMNGVKNLADRATKAAADIQVPFTPMAPSSYDENQADQQRVDSIQQTYVDQKQYQEKYGSFGGAVLGQMTDGARGFWNLVGDAQEYVKYANPALMLADLTTRNNDYIKSNVERIMSSENAISATMANIEENYLPVFKAEEGFDATKFLTEKNINPQNFDDDYVDRIYGAKSTKEIQHWLGLDSELQEQNKRMGEQNFAGSFIASMMGMMANPLEASSMFVGGGVSGLIKGGRATKVAVEVGADAAAYASARALQGRSHTVEDTAMDLAFGAFLGGGIAGLSRGSEILEEFRANSLKNLQESAEFQELQRGSIYNQIKAENPGMSDADVDGKVAERMREIFGDVNQTPTSVAATRENLSAEEKGFFATVSRERNRNKRQERANSLREAKRQAFAAQAEMKIKADEGEVSVKIDPVNINEMINDATVKVDANGSIVDQQNIKLGVSGKLEVDLDSVSGIAPQSVIDNTNKVVDEANKVDIISEAANIVQSMKDIKLSRKLSGLNRGQKYGKVSTAKIDFQNPLLALAWNKQFKAGTKVEDFSKDWEKIKEAANAAGFEDDFLKRVNDLLHKRLENYVKENGIARNNEGAPVIRSSDLVSDQDLVDLTVAYTSEKAIKNASSDVNTINVSNPININKAPEAPVEEAAGPKLDEKAEARRAAKEKAFIENLDKKNDYKILTEVEILKKNGIEDQFASMPFEDAVIAQLSANRAKALIDEVEASIDPARKARHEKAEKKLNSLIPKEVRASSITLSQSKSSILKAWSYTLGETPLGAKMQKTSALAKKKFENLMMGSLPNRLNEAKGLYAQQSGRYGIAVKGGSKEAENAFNTAFYEYRRLPQSSKKDHPYHDSFKSLDAEYTRLFRKDAEIQKKFKLVGHDLIEGDSSNYIPQSLDYSKFNRLTENQKQAFTDKQAQTILANNPLLTEKDAAKISLMYRSILETSGIDKNSSTMSTSPMSSTLSDAIGSAVSGMKDLTDVQKINLAEEIRYSIENMKMKKMDQDIDEVIKSKDGDFTMASLMEQDVFRIANSRIQKTSGWAALAEVNGLKSNSEYLVIRAAAIKQLRNKNVSQLDAEREIEALDQIMSELTGTRMNGFQASQGLSTLASAARTMMLQGAGFTQLMEYATVAISLGPLSAGRVALKTFGAARRAKKIANGQKTGNSFSDAQAETGYLAGVDGYRKPVFSANYLDDKFIPTTPDENSLVSEWQARVGNAVKLADRATMVASGMRMITSGMQHAVMEEIAYKAISKALKSDGLTADMIAAGIDPDQIRSLHNKGVLRVDGSGSVDFKMAYDAETAAEIDGFMQSVYRFSTQVIQETHIGEKGMWVNSNVWRAALFMRSYVLTAMFKQTGRLYTTHGAGKSFLYAMGASVWSGAILTARMHFNTLGMSENEREKYLKKHMSPLKMATAGIMYSGPLSIFGDILNMTAGTIGSAFDVDSLKGISAFRPTNAGVVAQAFPIVGGFEKITQGVTRGDLSNLTPLSKTPLGRGLDWSYETFGGD